MSHDRSEYLVTREVAQLLRVKQRKIYDLVARNRIPYVRSTGKILFPKQKVERWLAQKTDTSQAHLASETTPLPPTQAVIVGSHDPLLEWALRATDCAIASYFNGSLDGLQRLADDNATAAVMHVYEPEHDNWNCQHVLDYAAHKAVVVIEWAKRQQGLIVRPDSTIDSLHALSGTTVVQRQRTSGAALLLNHLLAKAGVDAQSIHWLDTIAHTESEAALMVVNGSADAAPGIAAMAKQFNLQFIATQQERVDLVLLRHYFFEPAMQTLLAFTRSTAFSDQARRLGGYDISRLGQVHWNSPVSD